MGRVLADSNSVQQALAGERRLGRRVVFTNGVFDMLHAGHVRSLTAASSLGDALVVGLNDDASVKRLKGDKRPIVPCDQRAEILAALSSVSYVIPFSEDTPERLIHEVKPDVLVKGKDYEGKLVVGADFVTSYGGKVELLPMVPGISTSDLVTEILQRFRA